MQGKFALTTERPCFSGGDGADNRNTSSPTSLSNVQERFNQLSIGKREGIDTKRVPSLRSVFNADAAANRLPAELVVKIFMSGAWTEWHELLLLSHICRHWRDVARGTPQLWADAVASIFKLGVRIYVHSIRCLPTLLSWSEPCPLRLEIHSRPASTGVVMLENHFIALKPHSSQLCHLSVRTFSTNDVVAVFKEVRSGMSHLESLHIKSCVHISRSDERVALDDSGLPRLHTLSVPGIFFTRAVALKTLKSVTLYDHPRSHEVFLAALERCSVRLESLTIENFAHPHWVVEESASLRPPVRLGSLRRLQVSIGRHLGPPPGFISGISFPSYVAIDLHWKKVPGNTHALLPKHLIDHHTPPFFDAMCLLISGSANTVILNYFVSGAERGSVREDVQPDTELRDVLTKHMSATVTELTVNLDFDRPLRATPFIDGDCLSSFVLACPSLRRLDLLGKNVIDVELQMAKAFLDSLTNPMSRSTLASSGCLAFSLEVQERPLEPDECSDQHMDEFRYTMDYQIATVREHLDKVEALLKAHRAAGGLRLRRLELCITIVRGGPRPRTVAVGAPYYRVADIPPSSHWARKVSWFYLPRFQPLVDEVVFFGQPQTLAGGVH